MMILFTNLNKYVTFCETQNARLANLWYGGNQLIELSNISALCNPPAELHFSALPPFTILSETNHVRKSPNNKQRGVRGGQKKCRAICMIITEMCRYCWIFYSRKRLVCWWYPGPAPWGWMWGAGAGAWGRRCCRCPGWPRRTGQCWTPPPAPTGRTGYQLDITAKDRQMLRQDWYTDNLHTEM